MPVPRATARLQLHKDFTFADAERVIPYYAALGVSHIYASPILTARAGSAHGYDIVDPTRINPELGGPDGFRRFVSVLRAHGMGLIQDIVPNHMGVGPENPWWQHVLEWGQKSPYASWFDIDWQPADETLQGKVLAPFLGKPYGEALAAGDIRLDFDPVRGKLFIRYFSHCFPVAPWDYAGVFRRAGSERLSSAVASFENFRGEEAAVTQHNAELGFGLLRNAVAEEEGKTDIEAALAAFDALTPQGFDALHKLLERQNYRLSWWRVAADAINWRRFFEVTDLVGVRVEQDAVFEATHALIFRLYAEGLIDGVRIDHVDGLADPGGYCRKLRARLQALSSQRPVDLAPALSYIVVEKILAQDEPLREGWEVDGTTGYEFMDQVGALLHDAAGEAPLTALWAGLTGQEGDFLAEVRLARQQLLTNNLAGEFEAAARALHAAAKTDLRTRDFSLGAIRRVFTELLVCFPVYRIYVGIDHCTVADRETMEKALTEARQRVDRNEVPLLEVIARWLWGEVPATGDLKIRGRYQRAITRFQQLTPPLAAKSVEDTAFYRYGRLLSRNEVGADPSEFSRSAASFHEACRARAARFPRSLLATATHDHKRGEDVRARIAVLSEAPEEWAHVVKRWLRMNAWLRAEIPEQDGTPACVAPQPADELMLYQMLVGAWPFGVDADDHAGLQEFAGRIEQWQTKALREAKQVSDWVIPNQAYEAACRDFLYGILDPRKSRPFIDDLAAWVKRIAPVGAAKGLAQTVIRLTAPGIPDLYQGTDFWDLSLVDPDNRRPVDYAARMQALKDAKGTIASGKDWETGYLKQQVIHRLLALRARHPELFCLGDYVGLDIRGEMGSRAIGFCRRYGGKSMIVIAAHLPYRLMHDMEKLAPAPESWGGAAVVIPSNGHRWWTDVLTGKNLKMEGRVELAAALELLPVSVLVTDDEHDG